MNTEWQRQIKDILAGYTIDNPSLEIDLYILVLEVQKKQMKEDLQQYV